MDEPRLPFSTRYRLVAPIRGGHLPAFRLRDSVRGTDVYWRVLPACDSDATRLALAHGVWSELGHPAAAAPGEWGRTETGDLFLTAAWVEGSAALAAAPLPPRQVERVLATLAEVLAGLHARGWLHGDLRPDALLLDTAGHPVLTSWHRIVPEGGAPHLPKPAALPFTAPEVLRGGRPDRRSDVYALGAVVHAMLTGAPPHAASSPQALREAILTQPVRRPSGQMVGIPASLDQLLASMLAKEPADRPRDMAAVCEALGRTVKPGGERTLLQAPLKGHQPAMERFQGLLEDLGSGRGTALWLHGPGGVGKTSLAEACVARAQLAGVPVVFARGHHREAPWMAWRRVLEGVLPLARARAGAARVESIAAVLQALDALCLQPPAGSERQALQRSRLQDASCEAIACAASDRGLVIVIDDGDRLDSCSQAALAHVQRALRVAGSPPVGLAVIAAEQPRLAGWHTAALPGLDEHEFTSWLSAVIGGGAVPRRFASALHAHAGGRPGIARYALQHLVAQGIVASRVAGTRLPETLWAGALPAWGGALEQRLVSALDDDARALGAVLALSPAAAVPLDVAASTLGFSGGQAQRAAVGLLASGLAGLGAQGLRLASPTLEAAFLEHAGSDAHAARLARLRALELPDPAPLQALLDQARLLLASPAEAHAAEVGLEAARRCLAAGAAPEAAALFEAVHAGLSAQPAQAPAHGLLEAGLGLLTCQAVAAPAAGDVLALARRCMNEHPDDPRFARLLLSALRHASLTASSVGDAALLRDEAVTLAERLGEPEIRDGLLVEEARVHLEAGRGSAAAETVAKVLSDRGNEPDVPGCRALVIRGRIDLEGDTEQQAAGLGDLATAASLQEKLGDHGGLLATLGVLVSEALRLGRWTDVTSHGARLLALPCSHDQPLARQAAAAAVAFAQLELGQANEALETIERLASEQEAPFEPCWQATAAASRFVARVLLGRLSLAEADLEGVLQGLLKVPAPLLGPLALACVRGLLTIGRADQAYRLAQELQFVARGAGVPQLTLAWNLAMAEVSARRGEPLAAHSFAEQAHEAATALALPHWQARAATQRALAALEAEAFVLATRHALEAEGHALACKGRVLVAEARLIAGEATLKSGGPDAVGHFQVARMIADDAGALLLRACALDGLGRCSPLAPEASSYLADAQRLLRQAAQGLGEASLGLFEGSRLIRHIVDRRAGSGGLSMTAQSHQSMLDRLGRLSAELTGVTANYGLMIDAWGAKREQLRKLNELARSINGSLELDDVARAVLQVALELTGAERAYILLKTQGRYEDLIVRAGLDSRGKNVLGQRFSMSICLRVAATGEAAAVMDGAGVEGIEPGKSVAALNLKTLMCAPLMVKGRCIGVLYVDSQAVLKAYTLQDLDQLSAIAAHASIAFDNALLYDSLKRHTAELEKTLSDVRKAEAAAGQDTLTGLRNRRAFMATADRELALAKRQRRSLAVVLLDVDHFKRFNDDFGHHVGDEVLRLVGGCLLQAARETDLPARLGGEEFAVLCPETEPGAAMRFAERLRAQIEGLTPSDPSGRPLRAVTASIGVAGWTPEDATIDVVLARADRALYAAKGAGRNQCRLAEESGAGKA
jgi:diguanylate cyclase (GGDEF)-like protein